MTIYERIKNRRKELGLSASDVASALGVSRATVYRYESSYIEKLPTSALEPLAKVLRCSPGYLMGWESDTSFNNDLNLSEVERQIILTYRKADDFDKTIVLRALHLDNEFRTTGAKEEKEESA